MINNVRPERYMLQSVFAATVLIVALGAASAQTASTLRTQSVTIAGSPSNIRPGHVLVRFKTTPGQDVLNQLNTAFGARLVGTIREIGVMHLQAPPERTLRLVAHLRNRPDVEFAEFDSVAQAIFQPNDPYYSSTLGSSHYGSVDQWGPPAVSAPGAWGSTLGDRNIVIAIVDTGVDDTHPELASKIVGEYSYVGKTKDGFGHGTHVAGIAAAATNNKIGIAGMCPNCGILSVKVLNDNGSGYMSDVASGITYAASHGARVINMSLGGANRTETLHAALDYALAHNALPVCAMGNNGASFALEPAYWHDCLSVIATDTNGAKASFSNYGVKADVAAPGVAILSTMPTYPVTLNKYGYYENYDALSGTSMATPMVSGIAGLVLSKNPNLTALQLRGILEASAGDGTSWTPNLAFGIVDASRAVAAAVNSDYVAPNLNLISPAEGATVSGLITFQAAPSDNTSVHHIDFVKDGSRFLQVMTGKSGTTWGESWSSTGVFNGPLTLSISAVDVFGNTVTQGLDLSVQNNLVTQTGTAHLCWPSTTNCPHTIWQPVTTGVATEAATHLHGTVTYGTLTNTNYQDFWLQVGTVTKSAGVSNTVLYFCGVPTTTVDCYPDPGFILLQPGKNSANYSGGQIDLISPNNKPSSGSATINWTLTYPQ